MLVLISLFILTSYTVAVCCRWGVPKSLSRTFFSIKNKWIFSAVVSVCFCLIFNPLINILPMMWQWLGFLTVGGGLLIAFAPNLNDELEEQVHMTGAIIMGLASLMIVAVLCPWLLLIWILWIPFAFDEKRVFWAEIIGGAILFMAMFVAIH